MLRDDFNAREDGQVILPFTVLRLECTLLLVERKWALITAAVTGEFDMSTASGRTIA